MKLKGCNIVTRTKDELKGQSIDIERQQAMGLRKEVIPGGEEMNHGTLRYSK